MSNKDLAYAVVYHLFAEMSYQEKIDFLWKEFKIAKEQAEIFLKEIE